MTASWALTTMMYGCTRCLIQHRLLGNTARVTCDRLTVASLHEQSPVEAVANSRLVSAVLQRRPSLPGLAWVEALQ